MAEKIEPIEVEKLPLFHRILLKLPCPSLDFLPEVSKGIFWAIIVPIFVILQSFLSFCLLCAFRFPVNYLLAAAVPSVIFLFVARVTVERYADVWNAAAAEQGFKWNLEKSTKEYFQLLEKKKSKKSS